MKKDAWTIVGFWLALAFCMAPFVSAGLALLVGIGFGLTLQTPYKKSSTHIKHLLGACLVGLGATLDFSRVASVGVASVGYTIVSLIVTFSIGFVLAKLLKVDGTTSLLVTVGTAICGGSAIAAIAPLIAAKPNEISLSLATVFILNAVALYIFPPLGLWLDLNGEQFGLWAALAIHDTSSVVGAAMAHGSDALEVATTVKLTRALWILPLAFAIGLWHYRKAPKDSPTRKVSLTPLWYLAGFIAMSAFFSWLPLLEPYRTVVGSVAKRGLIIVLFLIGTTLSWQVLKSVGPRSLVFGTGLWAIVGSGLLVAVIQGWID